MWDDEEGPMTCATGTPFIDPAAHATELQALLRDVVIAADRMRDRWAESDEAVRKSLWTALHAAAEAAHAQVYPL